MYYNYRSIQTHDGKHYHLLAKEENKSKSKLLHQFNVQKEEYDNEVNQLLYKGVPSITLVMRIKTVYYYIAISLEDEAQIFHKTSAHVFRKTTRCRPFEHSYTICDHLKVTFIYA